MATTIIEEKEMMTREIPPEEHYILDRHIVFEARKDGVLVYVGVGVANVTNIFVELQKKTVRAIMVQPRILDGEKLEYKLVYVCNGEENTDDNAIAIAHRIDLHRKTVHSFQTEDMMSVYSHITLATY